MKGIYLGLGTNLGDRAANLAQARECLGPPVSLIQASRVYESEPVGLLAQPLFLNQVVAGETPLLPSELLRHLKGIEQRLGRKPAERYGPRLIDLDILLYGDWVIAADGLFIPHQGLTERSFVLAPLAEIAPELRHPRLGQTISQIWAGAAPRLARSWLYKAGGNS